MTEHKQLGWAALGLFECSCGARSQTQRGIAQHLRNVERERESEGDFAYREHYA